MPQAGTAGLRILSPTLLEVWMVNTKPAGGGAVTCWDFVADGFKPNLPAPSQFAVTANNQAIEVSAVGFKRRPLYAPLKARDLRIENCLYLELGRAIPDHATVEVSSREGELGPTTAPLVGVADPMRWSPVLHVNQVGYHPALPKKAMVGYYLGSLGEMPVPTGSGFRLLDSAGKVVYQGLLFRRGDKGYLYSPTPYQEVWEADFTAFSTPGEYRLQVPGVGTSFPFLIDEGIAAAFARTFALGVYHQRCGTEQDLPFTRHAHGRCHTGPVQVPDLTYPAVNRELAMMTSDSAQFQGAPALQNIGASLYPFVDYSDRDVTGGHHDAGDYSRYTINSAGFIHYLVFAVDAFPGVGELDNLGLPESGDGKSDLLQEAKWEADFLAKMQDADGGFYFLVYPRDREYENDVLPDRGDPQVVFPKTTAVTAAAVAALAEAGSSPLFKQQFPAEAALYRQKAAFGWNFLQQAIAKHGKAGAYQKITHYGNEFGHDDELAWAAAAMFAATGDAAYDRQLQNWYHPSDPKTRRWSWWRLFEGYGRAVRTYAFAARTGRLPSGALDPVYLFECEAEIRAAAEDQRRFAAESAYGTSFPEPNKNYRSAGWYFSSERAFDMTVAYQLEPRADFAEAVVSNWNYEAGCNPVNMAYITGLGSRRQREIVHQYAQNDRRVLPPSGIPLGNVQASYQQLEDYQRDLAAVTFPSDSAATAPYPYYDRWTDTFNTTTEFVITDQARSLASTAFWMAQTSIRTQPWRAAPGQITGLPARIPAEESVTARLEVEGIDLTGACVVWEGRDQEPMFGNPVSFAARTAGEQWVEVEAQLPDGRRIMARGTFQATTSQRTLPNGYQSVSLAVSEDMLGLFALDNSLADSTAVLPALTLEGNARLDDSNLGWMAQRTGTALQFDDLGDRAILSIPSSRLRSGPDTRAVIVEAMIYIDAFVAFNRNRAPILSLVDAWDASLEFGEDKYTGPYFRGGSDLELIGAKMPQVLRPKQWHHLALELNRAGYMIRINGTVVASQSSAALDRWGRGQTAQLELGNFSGWIDELVLRSVQSGAPPNSPPLVNFLSPSEGARFFAPGTILLAANAADADGSIAAVEFFAGETKLGEVSNGAYPYSLIWNGVTPGSYAVTAKATDNLGAAVTSLPISITIEAPTEAVAAPTVLPNGGSYVNAVTFQLSTATEGAAIRYTTDGTEPGPNAPIYSGACVLSSSTSVRAQAFKAGLAASPVSRADFFITHLGSSGARATFVGTDPRTQGNWHGVYGADGYMLAGSGTRLPSYAQLATAGEAQYAWSATAEDTRALQNPTTPGRTAGCWFATTSFTLTLDFIDGKTHRVAVYCVDWDRNARAQDVEVLDAATDAVLDVQSLNSFTEGKYLIWDLKGRVRLRCRRVSGPNAVVAGLFFDPRLAPENGLPVAPMLSSSAPIIPGGAVQLKVTGESGEQVVMETSNNLVDWQPISTNTLGAGEVDLSVPRSPILPHRFYRTRAVSEPRYLVEASRDLVTWVPVSLQSNTNLAELTGRDAMVFSNRFYRLIPLPGGTAQAQ